MSHAHPAVTALMNYWQADEDGVIVTASRQAIHETVGYVDTLAAENAALRSRLAEAEDQVQTYKEGWADAADDRTLLRRQVADLEAERDALSDKASSLLITNYDLRKERDRLETTAGHLLDDALVRLHHPVYCPRSMGDYNCSCGLSKLKDRIKDWLKGLP